MERLTENKEYLESKEEYERHLAQGYPRNIPKERFLKLCEYEQAEEDGLLLRLPCPIGATVHIVNHYWIDEGHICGIAESDDVDCFCYKVYCDPDYYDMVALVEFNKTWFLTKAEAEQALAKMKGV